MVCEQVGVEARMGSTREGHQLLSPSPSPVTVGRRHGDEAAPKAVRRPRPRCAGSHIPPACHTHIAHTPSDAYKTHTRSHQ